MTKHEGEIALNSMTLDQIPKALRDLLMFHRAKGHYHKGHKFGEIIRTNFRPQFNAWVESGN